MKQCISRIIKAIIHLWRTLKEYVCKRVKVSKNRDFTVHIDTELFDVTIESGKEDEGSDS